MNCDTLPALPEGYRFVRRRGAGTFRSPERPAFANSGKSGQGRRQKPMVFGGVLFHISFAVERNMAAGGINAGRGCSPQSENGKRAVGDAGPYGGIDESTPVSGGAPIRAVGDAGPYGGIDESAPVSGGAPMRAVGDAGPYEGAAIEVRRYPKMYRCGYDNGARHHQCGTRERQRGREYKRFGAEPFCTAVTIGRKGNPKTVGFWRRSFPYFFRC